MTSERLVAVDSVEFVLADWTWPFVTERRTEIDSYFVTLQRENPALWNGRLLLLRDFELAGSLLRATLFETDYANLLAGIDWKVMGGNEVRATFGVAALRASDQSYVVGTMAPHTRNAGQVYFPSGSLDAADVVGTTVNLLGNVKRELFEETGLPPDEFEYEPGWHAVFTGPRIPMLKTVLAKENGQTLRERILSNLATQEASEFSDIHLVRGPSDIDSRMPMWMRMFFAHIWP